MNISVVVTQIPICFPTEDLIWKFLTFIPFLHLNVILVGFLYSFYTDKYYLISITMFSAFSTVLSYGLQDIIGNVRPYLECKPFFYTRHGLPCPEIVSVTSTATSILMYTILFREVKVLMKRNPKYENGIIFVENKTNRNRSILRYLITIVNILASVFFMFGYPLIIYLFKLCTVLQLILTTLLSICCTILFCFVIIRVFNKNYIKKCNM